MECCILSRGAGGRERERERAGGEKAGGQGHMAFWELAPASFKSNLVYYNTTSLEDTTLHEKDKYCVIPP